MKKTMLLITAVAVLAMIAFLPIQGQSPTSLPTFTVTVNYSQPLAQQIAAGKFNRVNPEITSKNFPSTKTGTRQINVSVLTLPRTWVKTKQVLEYIDTQGYRPATIEELLAFAAAYPKEWQSATIVALGSTWQRSPGVIDIPFINVYENKLWLWLRPLYLDWVLHKFLVVKK